MRLLIAALAASLILPPVSAFACGTAAKPTAQNAITSDFSAATKKPTKKAKKHKKSKTKKKKEKVEYMRAVPSK